MNRRLTTMLAVTLLSSFAGCKSAAAKEEPARIAALEAEVKSLRGLALDQASVMTIQAYHFTNLWFALDQENWPLGAFYLNETRKNLKWAVRVTPVRKDKNGADVNVAAIAESLDNGPLTQLKEAIDARDKLHAVKAYKDTLAGCYGCHEAAGKPFLRPRIPLAPQVQILSFVPGAALPE